MADGGQAELGKENEAFSILLVNFLMSQGFIAIPAGEQGEEITQTPGDVTELMHHPCEHLGKSNKDSKDPVKTKRGMMAVGPPRDRAAYSSPRILKMTPHVHFSTGTKKSPAGDTGLTRDVVIWAEEHRELAC
ncbi:hypothetical protein BTVI_37202 [Pitangus sulphuratus]|nr:hypothetical protein BTVI_37202 [Pitangus sulphuratus]